MKKYYAIILAALVALLPVLSACDLLGMGNSQDKDRQYYEEQIKAYQKAQEADQKNREAYNEGLKKGLEEYYKAYNEWSANQTQQEIQAAQDALKAKQGK
jgi:DNA phosphorothioation-dependent restriction protein DptG